MAIPTFTRTPEDYYAAVEVSFAEKSDLKELANIHAGTSKADPLVRCTLWEPERCRVHRNLGDFHYGQAFAAETDAIVLKVTDQMSGEIAGCAWLQLHTPPAQLWTTPRPFGFSPSGYYKTGVYDWAQELFHRQRWEVFRQIEKHAGEVPHYCELWRPISHCYSVD